VGKLERKRRLILQYLKKGIVELGGLAMDLYERKTSGGHDPVWGGDEKKRDLRNGGGDWGHARVKKRPWGRM